MSAARRLLRAGAATAVAVALLAGTASCGVAGDPPWSSPPSSSPPSPSPPPGSLVGRDGAAFTVDGAPTPLTGINVYNAASNGNCWIDMRDGLDGALATVATASQGRANVIRVWFFQRLAVVDGRRDWTEFDRVLATARERGFRVIPVLTDQWGACEGPDGTGGPYKDVSWYRDGYRDPARGDGTVSYRDWAREVVTRYRGDPTVAMWSLVNEAEARSTREGACPPDAADVLARFGEDVGRLVKSIDPAHLLGIGTIGGGQCGASAEEYQRLHAPDWIDFCEYHDYDVGALPGDPWNGLTARIEGCAALGKPLLIGESGVVPDEVGGVEARAQEYRRKLAAQREAGAAGFLMWGWSPNGYGPGDEYGIGVGDPSLPILAE